VVEANVDWDEKRAKEEFKTMLGIPSIAPTVPMIANHNKAPQARFTLTTEYHYEVVITQIENRAPNRGRWREPQERVESQVKVTIKCNRRENRTPRGEVRDEGQRREQQA
jgi:hypothetical protein